jgi:8-oxo-dGTP pyrophosphatase MutT (NUDIX family)
VTGVASHATRDSKMAKRKTRDSTQFAALPCRTAEDGSRQVMLVTSRETRRWIIPKGWPIKGLKPPKVAAQEAHEEAGLVGVSSASGPLAFFITRRLCLTTSCFARCTSFYSGSITSSIAGLKRGSERPDGSIPCKPLVWWTRKASQRSYEWLS